MKVSVLAVDKTGVLANVSAAISECEANISRAEITTREDQKAQLDFVIEVMDTAHLDRVLKAIERVDGVITGTADAGMARPLSRMLKTVALPPAQPLARQDALLPELRSRLGSILNVAMGKSWSWPAQGGAGEMTLRLRFCLGSALLDDCFEQPDVIRSSTRKSFTFNDND